mmetsp:Transcript_64284/g.150989  ORF Transcript_64284/g.150989 Transcript_64284/m.150989 type:complete len:286 (+) Transcript_64284:152-1009(+)
MSCSTAHRPCLFSRTCSRKVSDGMFASCCTHQRKGTSFHGTFSEYRFHSSGRASSNAASSSASFMDKTTARATAKKARTGLSAMTAAPAHMITKPVYAGDLTTAKGPLVAIRPFSMASVTVTRETSTVKKPTMEMARPTLKVDSGENRIFSRSNCSNGYCTGRKEAATQAPCAWRKESPASLGKGVTFFSNFSFWTPLGLGLDLDLGLLFLAELAISSMLTCFCCFPFAGEANVCGRAPSDPKQSHSDTHKVTARTARARRCGRTDMAIASARCAHQGRAGVLAS